MAPFDIIRSFSHRPSRPKLRVSRRQRRRQKKDSGDELLYCRPTEREIIESLTTSTNKKY